MRCSCRETSVLGIQEVRNSPIIPNLRSLHVRKVVLSWRVTSSDADAELQASLPAVVSLCGAFKHATVGQASLFPSAFGLNAKLTPTKSWLELHEWHSWAYFPECQTTPLKQLQTTLTDKHKCVLFGLLTSYIIPLALVSWKCKHLTYHCNLEPPMREIAQCGSNSLKEKTWWSICLQETDFVKMFPLMSSHGGR